MFQYRDTEKSRTSRVNQFKTLCLTLMLCVGASTAANAGSYTVNYSGGVANFNDAFITGVNGYTDVPYTVGTNGFYGGGGTARWQGGSPPTSAHVTCEGQITATFTWQPTGNSTDDPPPDKVVIAQQCNTSMSSYSYSQATGTANNALGFPFVQDASVSNSASGHSNGSLYQIKDTPGLQFTITCSPTANVAGTGPDGVPVSWSGSAGVSYKATALPLELVLSGGIGPRNQKRFLIGQRVTGTLSTGGLTASGWNWTIDSGEPFGNWNLEWTDTYSHTSATFVPLGTQNQSQVSFCFKKGPQTSTVSTPINLAVPPGALPAAGLTTTLTRQCGVDTPSKTIDVYIGTVQGVAVVNNKIVASTTPEFMKLYGATTPEGSTVGIYWRGTVTTPSLYGEGGGWNVTQLVDPIFKRIIDGVLQNTGCNGVLALDTTFGYEPVSPAPLYTDDGAVQGSSDGPQTESWAANTSAYTMNHGFYDYMMYLPNGSGSCYVPLREFDWFCVGQAQLTASTGLWQISNTDSGWSLGAEYPDHPEWASNAAHGLYWTNQ